MAQAIFADGFPARITVQDFLRYHAQQFPRLLQEPNHHIIEDAIDDIYGMFYGVQFVWELLAKTESGKQAWFDKTQKCYRLLVAWYIADLNPLFLSGLPVMGGIALARKKIGGVDITFADKSTNRAIGAFEDLLGSLNSNPFGAKAYMMIRMAGRRAMLRNHPSV